MPTIQDVLQAPKTPTWPARRKLKSPDTQTEVDIDLACTLPGLKGQLVLYARVLTELPEIFSVGLKVEMRGRAPSLIIRANGGHGQHKNPDGTIIPAKQPHIHVPTSEELSSEYSSKVKLVKALPIDHADAVSAWSYLAQELNIEDDGRVTRLVSELCATNPQIALEEALHGR